ncbi:MAG TPA: T9SS type A sorting domain-containing protein [bacterium]
MNKHTVLSVILAFITFFTFTPGALFGYDDATTGLTTPNFNEMRSVTPDDNAPLAGPRQRHVIWDTTHGVYLNYQPFVRYLNLVAMLNDSGFTIECCGTGLHTIDLTQYSIIVITVGCSWNSAYTQEEVDSILSYYNNGHQRILLTGDMNFCEDTYLPQADNIAFTYNVFEWLASRGGILIMGDNPGCPNANINPVANAFSMTAGTAALSPSDLYFSNFTAHTLFDGITQIYYRAAGQVAAISPAAAIAWTANNEPTIALLDQMVDIDDQAGQSARLPGIQVAPNPFTRQTAVLTNIPDAGDIRVYDASGKIVETVRGNVIGKNLMPGLYFLMVQGYEPVKLLKLQ